MMQPSILLPVQMIEKSPQIEKLFEAYPYPEEEYDALRKDIELVGILVPLIVCRLDSGRYELLAGHTRYRIARELGMQEVPCSVAQTEHERIASIYDNVKRRQMSQSDAKRMRKEEREQLADLQARTARQDADAQCVWTKFVAALEGTPESERDTLLERIVEQSRGEVSASVEHLIQKLAYPAQQAAVTLKAEHEATEEQRASEERIAQLEKQLEAAKTLISNYQQKIDSQNDKIAELSRMGPVKEAAAQTVVQEAKIRKEIEKELAEAKAQAVEFSKKLGKTKTELDTVSEALAAERKRARGLDERAQTLQEKVKLFYDNWQNAIKVSCDVNGIGMDLVRAVELLDHVSESLQLTNGFRPDVESTIRNGLKEVDRAMKDLLTTVEAMSAATKSVSSNNTSDEETAVVSNNTRPNNRRSAVVGDLAG
jgi:ParB-like chromosome segregation protein Spo0J